jgi:hypothetical protein
MSIWSDLDSTLQNLDRLRNIGKISGSLKATLKRVSEVGEQGW